MLALTLTANALPMIIGSISGWLWLAGITARPRGDLVAHQLGGHALAGGDERHLGGDLAGPGALQLGAAVADHAGPRRQARPSDRSSRRRRCRARRCRRGRSGRRWTGARAGTALETTPCRAATSR